MDRPEWVPPRSWTRLEAVLLGQPAHAWDVLDDLEALTVMWSCAGRSVFLERFVGFAEAGMPLPAAYVLALGDMLGD